MFLTRLNHEGHTDNAKAPRLTVCVSFDKS